MRDLLGQIVRGEHAPGDMLPKEVDLAAQYAVSRGVAREVIRGLEERGMVEVVHGRGQRVSERAAWDVFDAEVLSTLLAADRVGLARDVLEAQRLLEVQAVGLAARRRADEHVEALEATLQAMDDSAALAPTSDIAAARFRVQRLDFHRRLMQATGNQVLGGLVEPLYRALATAATASPSAQQLSDEVAECRRVLAAIVAEDEPAAIAAVDAHLSAFAERLLGD
jgi:GntR family transcriptional repressor for pyruvate dehydrogenase complex